MLCWSADNMQYLRHVEDDDVVIQIVGPRGVLFPAIRHANRDGLMQVSCRCCGCLKHVVNSTCCTILLTCAFTSQIQMSSIVFRDEQVVTLCQEMEVDEEVRRLAWPPGCTCHNLIISSCRW